MEGSLRKECMADTAHIPAVARKGQSVLSTKLVDLISVMNMQDHHDF
jgi:hypothetical protein